MMTNYFNNEFSPNRPQSEKFKSLNVQNMQIPNEIVFPNELNQHLREQIQYLSHENIMLKKQLSENEVQLVQSKSKAESLSTKVNEYETACTKKGYINASNLASSKIVEQSKQLREKNSEIEVLKTKCSKLQQCILKLEDKNNIKEVPVKPESPPNELKDKIKELQDKLETTNSKLFEAKNLNLQLKNDLKMANKLLQQEVGENFENLQKSLSNSSNWRGRAQLICELQQKNNELREKMKSYQDKQNPVKTLSKAEIQNETLIKENSNLKNEYESVTKKYETVRVRCKYYESECCSLKAKLTAKTEQNEKDCEIISGLTAQISHSKDFQNDTLKLKQLIINKLEQENKQLKLTLEKEKCKFINMQKEIDVIKKLESEDIKKKYVSSPKRIDKANVDDKNISVLEVEKQKLLELNQICNKRLETERNAHASTQNKFLLERQRAAKLEAKVARMQLQSDRSSSYSTLGSQTKMCENNVEDQLELAKETIKTLQTRLQIEKHERRLDFQEFSKIIQNHVNLN